MNNRLIASVDELTINIRMREYIFVLVDNLNSLPPDVSKDRYNTIMIGLESYLSLINENKLISTAITEKAKNNK